MKPRMFSSFKARMMAASIVPIILLSVAASLNSAVSNANIRRVSELFSLDIFMKETLADVDSVVSNLAVYIDTKNTDALRAYMHAAKILSAKSNELTGGPSYRQDSILEQNLSVLIRRLIVESEAAIRAKRGRNIPEYGSRYQEVTQIAYFIHDRENALSLERLELRLLTRHRLAIRIDVEDDGPGVPAEMIDRIFYPMVTTRPEGSGLGLPIAHYLVRRHEGMIECRSQPGETIFSIYLPLDTAS